MRFLPRLGYSASMGADATATPTLLRMLAGLLRARAACRGELYSQIESFKVYHWACSSSVDSLLAWDQCGCD
jgi:hypothetical protein